MSTSIMAGNADHAMRLRLVKPAEYGAQSYAGEVVDIFDVSLSFNESGEPGTLDLRTYKDSAGAAALQSGQYEIQVDLWDPRDGEHVFPENARFVVGTWEEDRVDESNVIHYRCPNALQKLDKVRLTRAQNATRLNNAYDRALDRLRETERPYERALERFEELAEWVKDRHGLPGRSFAYHGVHWLSKERNVHHGSLASNASLGGRLYYYVRSADQWRRLQMTSWPDNKAELMDRGVELAETRRAYNAARDAYDKAERAARETSRDGRRFFYNSTPGRTLHRFWQEATERDERQGYTPPRHGVLKGRRRTFSNSKDSRGVDWPASSRTNHDFPLGASLLQVLLDFQERGLIDFTTRQSQLDVVPAGALEVDQSDRVNLLLGRDLTSANERGSSLEHFAVAVIVAGDGQTHHFMYGDDPDLHGSKGPWGFEEGTISEPNADSRDSARSLTHRARQTAQRRNKIESTLGVSLGPSSAIPMIDYQPGHWISVWDHEGERSRRKVTQIVLRWSPEDPMTAIVTLDDRFTRRAVSFARTMSKTVGGVDHLQGHVPRDPALEPPILSAEAWVAPPIYLGEATLNYDTSRENWTVRLPLTLSDPGTPEPDDPDAFDRDLPSTESDPEDDGFIPSDEDD
ncbi:hypothetical protein [Nesterenkonia populi]|uniref:hypothetical protein n=1 Tax=Nesterenkonia populi TaxID=1591087 RepID=UPI0011BFACAB|nr:hypothetical protein [Nesterenkonia populi]